MALTKVGKEGITGIDNSSDATAITIDSSERVGIGETSPQTKLHIKTADASATADSKAALILEGTDATRADLQFLGDASAFQQVIFGDNSDADVGRIAYDHGANTMRLNVNAAEAARITSDGIDFRNASGTKYVLFKNGDGVHFGATAGGNATSTVLDDYEEGSFTPTIGGSSGNGSLSYSTQAGTYTKIGRAVNFNLVVIASSGVSGGSGTLQIDGLPYSARAASSGQVYGWYGNASIGYFFNLSSYGTATQSIKLLGPAAGNTYLRFHSFTNQGDASAPPTQANIQGSSAFYVGGSYEVD